MKNLFNSVKMTRPKSNLFDLTHDVKLSGKMGNLIPVMVMECVPGDKVTLAADILLRFAPLVAPVMHRADVTVHYFFCPNRLNWSNWEDFITGNAVHELPNVQINDATTEAQLNFLDYMGVPVRTAGTSTKRINALPLAAYQKIYNEYYRDQNLVTEVASDLVDGGNPIGVFAEMRKRSYEHDYFTSALPFAQKGDAVEIPLGTVELDPDWIAGTMTGQPSFVDNAGAIASGNIDQTGTGIHVAAGVTPNAYDPDGTLGVEPTTINSLRRAFKLQQFLEKMARGGTRYIEVIKSVFGIQSSDKRLQRPEYITGTKSPVIISEVLNTTGSFESGGVDPTSPPQGNMAGHAVSVGQGYLGKYNVEEHGYIIGILSVMPKTAYQQGIPKHYIKTDRLDWYWPDFANIGEQEVLNEEVFAYTATSAETFGYVPRYSEYKYIPSRVAGEFRTTLNHWHMGRIFSSQPTLSQAFLELDPDEVERIFAVQDGSDNLYMHVLNKVKARRLMPVYGTPML